MTLARSLRKAREATSLSQAELGRRTGICRTVINRYERGRGRPEIDNLVKLADALNVTTDELLGRKERVNA